MEQDLIFEGKAGISMQVVVVRSPKALRGILRRLFGIKKESKET